ncbi:MAG: DUF4349 domain-containing protein [Patescibacteria group bacterium]
MNNPTQHNYRWLWIVLIVAGIAVLASYSSQKNYYGNNTAGVDYDVWEEDVSAPMMARSNGKMVVQDTSFSEYEEKGFDDSVDRLVIRNAELSMVSEDVQTSVGSITEYVEKNKGFVVQVNLYDLEDSPSANLTVRVPEEILMDTIMFIREQGIKVVNETVSGEDVTEEFTDNQARLNNLEASEEQFLSIMKRAGKIEDVLAVQRELERVRESIERIEARQKYLKESAAMSRIQVYISTDEDELPILEEDQWRPLVVAKDALRSLIGFLQDIANGLIWVIIFLPVWGGAILVYRKYGKK